MVFRIYTGAVKLDTKDDGDLNLPHSINSRDSASSMWMTDGMEIGLEYGRFKTFLSCEISGFSNNVKWLLGTRGPCLDVSEMLLSISRCPFTYVPHKYFSTNETSIRDLKKTMKLKVYFKRIWQKWHICIKEICKIILTETLIKGYLWESKWFSLLYNALSL